MAIPAVAAAAYQAIANIGSASAGGSAATTGATGAGDFSNFLSTALKDGIGTMKQARRWRGRQITGQATHRRRRRRREPGRDHPEHTVVAVRDKVVQAYPVHHEHADLTRAPMTPADSIDSRVPPSSSCSRSSRPPC
ncbi:MAG: hypothetical protein WDN08_12225 [Rhizomicrobium sp.]